MIKKEIINKGPLIVKGLGMRTNSFSTRMMDSSSSSTMNNGGSGVGTTKTTRKTWTTCVYSNLLCRIKWLNGSRRYNIVIKNK